MYSLLKMGIFHFYASLPEGKGFGAFPIEVVPHFCFPSFMRRRHSYVIFET